MDALVGKDIASLLGLVGEYLYLSKFEHYE